MTKCENFDSAADFKLVAKNTEDMKHNPSSGVVFEEKNRFNQNCMLSLTNQTLRETQHHFEQRIVTVLKPKANKKYSHYNDIKAKLKT